MDRNNRTTKIRKSEAGFNMTVTIDKKYTLEVAVEKFIDKLDKPPEAIRTLCFTWGKYIQLFENEPVTEGGE